MALTAKISPECSFCGVGIFFVRPSAATPSWWWWPQHSRYGVGFGMPPNWGIPCATVIAVIGELISGLSPFDCKSQSCNAKNERERESWNGRTCSQDSRHPSGQVLWYNVTICSWNSWNRYMNFLRRVYVRKKHFFFYVIIFIYI